MGTHKGNSWSWPWGHTGEERPSKQGLLQGSQGPMACPYSISTLTLSLVIYSPGKWLLGVEKAKMQALPGRGARPGGGGGVHGSTWRLPSWLSPCRLLGMTAHIKTNHTEFWKFHLHPSLDWPEIVNPLILLLS